MEGRLVDGGSLRERNVLGSPDATYTLTTFTARGSAAMMMVLPPFSEFAVPDRVPDVESVQVLIERLTVASA